MEKLTYNEGIQADTLVLEARALLREAEVVAAGLLVRVTQYCEGEPPRSFPYPPRVARYAYRAVGGNALLPEGVRLVFSSRGHTVAVQPTTAGYLALCKVFYAYTSAELRRYSRKIRQAEAKARKGGQSA